MIKAVLQNGCAVWLNIVPNTVWISVQWPVILDYIHIYIYVCSILVDMALYVYSLVWTQSPSRAPNILQSQLVTSGRSRNSKYVNRKTRVQVMLVSGSSEE